MKITITLKGKPSKKLADAILESWEYSEIVSVEYTDLPKL